MSAPVIDNEHATLPACPGCGATFEHDSDHQPWDGFVYCKDCPNTAADQHGCVDHVCPAAEPREPTCVVSRA